MPQPLANALKREHHDLVQRTLNLLPRRPLSRSPSLEHLLRPPRRPTLLDPQILDDQAFLGYAHEEPVLGREDKSRRSEFGGGGEVVLFAENGAAAFGVEVVGVVELGEFLKRIG